MIKVKNLRSPFIALLAFIICAMALNPPTTIGLAVKTSSGKYSFAAGTQPWPLSLAVLIILAYLVLMYAEPSANRTPLPGLFRRFAAFWLDFLIAMMTASPIVGLLPAVVEWRRTGVFGWAVERNTPAAWDSLLTWVTFSLELVTLLLYFSVPLLRRRPSPGTCILGYQVVPEEGTSLNLARAISRTLAGFVAVCAAFAAPFGGREKKKGQFWLDKVFNTQAVRL
jgi:uncharacterized RDD family membrane protein YckC